MRNSADDIPAWLAGLSDRTLRRLNSRLAHLLRMVDNELQRRDLEVKTDLKTAKRSLYAESNMES